MERSTETLLALLASPLSGAILADARPSFVLDRTTLTPVLANAAGLKAMGAPALADLPEAFKALPERMWARISDFAGTSEPGQRRKDLVRYPQGDGLRMERLELTHLEGIGDQAMLLVVLASRAEALDPEASDGLAHLAGDNRFIVLFDEDGDAVASHGDETLLDDIHDEIEALAHEEDPSPVLIRQIRMRDGDREIGLVTLAGGPEQVLYLARLPKVDRRSRLKVPPRRRSPDPAPPQPVAEAPETIALSEPAPSALEPKPTAEVVQDDLPLAPSDTLPATEAVAVRDDEISDIAPEASTPGTPVQDVLPVTDDTVEVVTEAEADEKDEGTTPAAPSLPPIKFVWQMDGQRRFSLTSPELASVVGVLAAPRVGESWVDLASRLTIDVDGRVGHAISGQDTWSGLTVLWPIAGEARRVPVDLAAMPILGRKRAFEGFRGFGTVRPADALDDVTATGQRLTLMPPTQSDDDVAAVAPLENTVVTVPPRSDARIVTLPAAIRASGDAPRLTPPERNAFRQIAQALGVRIEGEDFVPVSDPDETRPATPARTSDRERTTQPASGSRSSPEAALLDRLQLAAVVAGDDVLLHANPAFLTLTGYESLDDFDAYGGLDALFAGRHALREAVRSGDPRPVPALTKTGAVMPVHARLSTVTWENTPAVLLTLEPIVEATPAATPEPAPQPTPPPPVEVVPPAIETALGDARQRIAELETILDTATDGVLILNSDGTIVTANRTSEALFGRERAEMTGAPLAELLAPESRRSALDYLDGLSANGVASVLNDGREVIGEVHPDGLIPLFMTMGRIGAGEHAKFCVVLRDITQWKKSEEELTVARRRAEEASLHKSDFLAKISHEIRTPLNAIIGFSEVMLDERFGTIGNDRYRDYLRDIHSSGTHIMSLVNDLLDLSKVEAGKMDLKFESVPLATLIGETVAMMQPQANRERIIIRTSLPGSVPPVVADTRSVRQIVLNLLSNAIKFTPAGGQVIVSIALEETGEVVMRVRDTGHGMTEKEVQTALEPFRQLHTTRPGQTGTGLGLPLTKALTEANRAAFAIDSTPGQGTLVTVTFPVNRVLA